MTPMYVPYFAADNTAVTTNNLPDATALPQISDNATGNGNMRNNTVEFTTAAYNDNDVTKYDITNNDIMTTAPNPHDAGEDNVNDDNNDTPTHAMTTNISVIDDNVMYDTANNATASATPTATKAANMTKTADCNVMPMDAASTASAKATTHNTDILMIAAEYKADTPTEAKTAPDDTTTEAMTTDDDMADNDAIDPAATTKF
mmetsp:Transcript_54543/g.65778  ORF Transcript_54543/g.65778 Transcript_54543/m.65778 type:complete len:203 (-) Transcript_54543:955-1563(-)